MSCESETEQPHTDTKRQRTPAETRGTVEAPLRTKQEVTTAGKKFMQADEWRCGGGYTEREGGSIQLPVHPPINVSVY